MIKLQVLTTIEKEKIQRVQNKKVEDVTEYKYKDVYMLTKSWIGSTEDEYFVITFNNGIVCIDINEREFLLGNNTIYYAMSVDFLNAISKTKNNKVDAIEAAKNYYSNLGPVEVNKIKFSDIMRVLKWKYVLPKRKIKKGFEFEY